MDIYILRAGQQTGPYSEADVNTLLKDGAAKLDDFAWRDGLPTWQPLSSVLYPKSASGIFPPPPKDAPTPTPEPFLSPVAAAKMEAAEAAKSDPGRPESATPKQKAFLTFLGIDFPGSLTKERATALLDAAAENPHKTDRMTRWENEKLRLHPELFAEELQARKENRAQRFLEVCQEEGADYFHDVTRAHTQVLVTYLDVQHPHWDERANASRYLFAALAEKFPQLVKMSAKSQLKYPGGPKAADEMERSGVATRPRKKRSPFVAMARGIGIGLILLAALYGTKTFYEQHLVALIHPAAEATPVPADGATPAPATLASGTTSNAKAPDAQPSDAAPSALAKTEPPSEIPAAPGASSPAPAAPTTEAPPAMAMNSSTPAAPPAIPEAAPAIPPAAGATPAPAPIPSLLDPAPAPPAPATPAPRTTVKITRPTAVTLRFGTSTLPAGAVVPIISIDAANVMVRFGPDIVPVPLANTDLSTPPAPQ
jgi:hypothetical protein